MNIPTIIPLFLSLLLLFPPLAICDERQRTYIVYLGSHTQQYTPDQILETHHSCLTSVKDSEEEARASLIYSYKHSINGFAASLTPQQASKLNELEEVVAVIESRPRKYSTHTTRSWEFSGLNLAAGYDVAESMKKETTMAEAGDLLHRAGYGVWPEAESFSDEGMEAVPKSWKGICQTGQEFNSSHCNKKIIGARYYIKGFETYYGRLDATEDYRSPRDKDGHGTHTAATFAGRQVRNASALGGFARGTASGGAPLARLAVYKVCWPIPNQEKIGGNTCFDEDMLAAMDDAIADGVQVISISIGADEPLSPVNDSLSIGALHAARKNVVVVCSGGNDGPKPGTVVNTPPWILTVGASNMDRGFLGTVVLGNGMKITGQTVTHHKLPKRLPLISAADAALPWVPDNETDQCLPDSLAPEKVRGKIVLCLRGSGTRYLKGVEVKRAGGAGFILANTAALGDDVFLEPHVLPTTAVTYDETREIVRYIRSAKGNATARLREPRTVLGYKAAPFMASFSSRGPNVIHPCILKPDVAAPGVNILAAWSQASPPTKLSQDRRSVKYNFDSGTSMACPHVAALAALLKAIHPTWSSAAIRSAIMTTASTRNNKGRTITDERGHTATPFQFGSGQFCPSKAADPGLVYDASYTDYLLYLCSYGLKNAGERFNCPKFPPPMYDLNYPSVSVPKLNGTLTIKRSVMNVGGDGNAVYFFSAKPPLGMTVTARPSVLFFSRVGERKEFTLTIEAREYYGEGGYGFGWYSWRDNYHVVRSPIAVSMG
ncbi:unnamed protein product [Linum tenue]|uniref:Subtilisin-like protease SBT5.6 n=1 Tax=Linum tenue TaxID=586396 RepID=A0AAV0RT04_9ROSI|nr:unnamed protein product [Linum tenue]